MTPRLCCGFGRPSSPEDSPVRLREVEAGKGLGRRFTISTDFSTEPSTEYEPSIQQIFYPPKFAKDTTPHSSQFQIRRRESLQAIHHAADKVKHKLFLSPPSPKSKASRVLGENLTTGNESDAREIHDSVARVILDHHNEIFDEDAVPIRTPGDSWSRQDVRQGSIQMSPSHLKKLLNRSSSPRPDSVTVVERPLLEQPSPNPENAGAFGKTLRDKAVQVPYLAIDEHDGDQATGGGTNPKHLTLSGSPTRRKSLRSTNLQFSHTSDQDEEPALHEKDSENRVKRPEDPPTPTLNPADIASGKRDISSVSSQIFGLPTTSDRLASFYNANRTLFSGYSGDTARAAEANPFRSPTWRRSASGVLDRSLLEGMVFASKAEHDKKEGPTDQAPQRGGVDGPSSSSHTRSHSEGSAHGSIHLYNMRISERLASNGIAPSVSSPGLRSTSGSELSWRKNPEFLSLKRRQLSSSGFSSSKVPTSWGSPKRNAASSVYSSSSHCITAPIPRPPQSEASSLKESGSPSPPILSQSAIDSLRSSRSQTLDTEAQWSLTSPPNLMQVPRTRQRTSQLGDPAAFDHPNAIIRSKSLSTAEIDSAEGRLLRRAHTVAQTRYFSQADIDELTAEIAARSPPRSRRVTMSFDGATLDPLSQSTSRVSRQPSCLSHQAGLSTRHRSTVDPAHRTLDPSRADWSRAGKLSMAAGYEPVGSSIWDKALFEHATEDVKLSQKRPGSLSTEEMLRRWNTKKNQMSKSSLGLGPVETGAPPTALTIANPDEDVMAHLQVYSLSPPVSTSGFTRRASRGHIRSSSSTSTSGSWSRFPAHSRRGRIEASAGEDDRVFSRDFAPSSEELPSVSAPVPPTSPVSTNPTPPQSKGSPAKRLRDKVIKKAHSSPFPKLRASVKDLYQSKSLDKMQRDIAGRLAVDEARGHKSSVSEGVMVGEYPELEMLAPLSPSLHSSLGADYFRDFDFRERTREVGRRKSKARVRRSINSLRAEAPPTTMQSPPRTRKRAKSVRSSTSRGSTKSSRSGKSKIGAAKWSKLYESCVQLPHWSSMGSSPSQSVRCLSPGWECGGGVGGMGGVGGVGGSYGMSGVGGSYERALSEHFSPLDVEGLGVGSGDEEGDGGRV